MRILSVDVKRYSLGLKRPLALKGGCVDRREGAFLFLGTDEGDVGVGEIAVLDGLHTETLDEAIDCLLAIKERIVGAEVLSAAEVLAGGCDGLFGQEVAGSVRLAVEMVFLDIARRRGEFDDVAGLSLPINGLVSADADDVLGEVDGLIAAGYDSIKVKVGRQSVERDAARVREVVERIAGRAMVRLDANRTWGLDEAVWFCDAVGLKGIEYIEEPLKDAGGYDEFFGRCDWPVALDESLVDGSFEGLGDVGRFEAFVLKPSLLGGFARAAGFIEIAREHGVTPVVSCTFQTSFTLGMFGLFAAKMGIVDVPLGLGTAGFFAEDVLVEPLKVADGKLELADIVEHGLGLNMGMLR